ncbi:MAG: helix-turn-helix domain-containing protein [Geminicoccaceae bacterium]|nr:helix-turn-helix domain-containing protein [Geminicoccaceae bacterium]
MSTNIHPPAGKLGYRISELVGTSGISRSTIYNEIKAGRLPVVKLGRSTIILASDARQWLESHRQPAKAG